MENNSNTFALENTHSQAQISVYPISNSPISQAQSDEMEFLDELSEEDERMTSIAGDEITVEEENGSAGLFDADFTRTMTPDETMHADENADSSANDLPANGLPANGLPANALVTNALMNRFAIEDLRRLQKIGVATRELAEDGSLELLSKLIPVKAYLPLANLSPADLSPAEKMVILLVPSLDEPTLERQTVGEWTLGERKIRLTAYPYLPSKVAYPLTDKQKSAVDKREPFFMVKRVTGPIKSTVFEDNQNKLWMQLSTLGPLSRSVFETLMDIIVNQPVALDQAVSQLYESEAEQFVAKEIVEALFPMQLALYTPVRTYLISASESSCFPHVWKLTQSQDRD